MNEDHFETESLEHFIAELKADGFQPAPENPATWRGNIHPAFAGLTDASTMEVIIRPGWPHQFPYLLVDGINTSHSTPGGFICLWLEGDSSLQWYTLSGFYSRIEEWCHQAKQGWPSQSLTQDAYLNHTNKAPFTATFDLPALQVKPGSRSELHGVLNPTRTAIDFRPGKSLVPNHLHGIWLHAGSLNGPPPRQLSEVFKHLSRSQSGKLEKGLKERHGGRKADKRGYDLILFCWTHEGQPNALAMLCQEITGKTETFAMTPGPKDQENLMLRAGPDAVLLNGKRAVIFGAGALGGHTALILAQSGIGTLDIVDPDVLLPGNIARHIAGHTHIGQPKVEAVTAVVADHAPWTEANPYRMYVQTPNQIHQLVRNADIVIDASGDAVLKDSLARTVPGDGKPLISGALFRGGAIGRIQRQAQLKDTPIRERTDEHRYPLIPRGKPEEELITSEAGCSAPVNNAPPASVVACAARIVQVAIDTLTERFRFGDETISVYRPIGTPPFDHIGEISTPPSSVQ